MEKCNLNNFHRSRIGGPVLDSSDLGQREKAVFCKRGSGISDFIKWEKFLTVSGSVGFQKDPTPYS
jgi:hypothetical protein